MGLRKSSDLKDFIFRNYHLFAMLLFVLVSAYFTFKTEIAADDFHYRQVAVCSPSVILQYLKWHYMAENGRLLVHVFVILMLRNKFTFVLWKILTVAGLVAYCDLIAKMASAAREQYRSAVMTVIFFFMTIVNIYTYSIYWLTGSFNYFYPMLFLLAIMYLSRKKPGSPALIPLALLCGATTEQVGIMCIGWFFLLTLDGVFKKKKPSIVYIICTVLAAAGYATVMLSPGISIRINDQGTHGLLNYGINLIKLLRKNWIDNLGMVFFMSMITFGVCYWLYKFKKDRGLSSKITVPAIVFLTAANILNFTCKLVLQLHHTLLDSNIKFSHGFNTAYCIFWFAYLLVFTVSLCYVTVKIYTERKEFIVSASVILAVGSQIMMSAAISAPKRCCLCGTTTFMFFIIYTLRNMYADFKEYLTLKKPNRKLPPQSVRKSLALVLCAFACVFQVMFFGHFRYTFVDFDKCTFEPLSSEQMTELTDNRAASNKIYFLSEDSAWRAPYNVIDFSLFS